MSKEITNPIKYIPVGELKVHPHNPRLIKNDGFERLKGKIERHPDMFEARPCLVNKEGVIFAGNMRFRAAIDLGWAEVPCKIMDVPEESQLEMMLIDNLQEGEWVYEGLGIFPDHVLDVSGFPQLELQKHGLKMPDQLVKEPTENKVRVIISFDSVEALNAIKDDLKQLVKDNGGSITIAGGLL